MNTQYWMVLKNNSPYQEFITSEEECIDLVNELCAKETGDATYDYRPSTAEEVLNYYKPMNNYALAGHKVKLADLALSSAAFEDLNSFMELGLLKADEEYTVARTENHDEFTYVELVELPWVMLDTQIFIDVTRQSVEQDMQHPDWRKYHQEEQEV